MKYRNDEAARAALKNLLENVIGLAEDLMWNRIVEEESSSQEDSDSESESEEDSQMIDNLKLQKIVTYSLRRFLRHSVWFGRCLLCKIKYYRKHIGVHYIGWGKTGGPLWKYEAKTPSSS